MLIAWLVLGSLHIWMHSEEEVTSFFLSFFQGMRASHVDKYRCVHFESYLIRSKMNACFETIFL